MGQKDRCEILESDFQYDLIREIKERFPGAIVLKNDAGYIQGFPDLTILYRSCWAVLEVKKNIHASRQPNQEYYVNLLNNMSFSDFICPENKEEVLNELEQTFGVGGHTRVSKPK